MKSTVDVQVPRRRFHGKMEKVPAGKKNLSGRNMSYRSVYGSPFLEDELFPQERVSNLQPVYSPSYSARPLGSIRSPGRYPTSPRNRRPWYSDPYPVDVYPDFPVPRPVIEVNPTMAVDRKVLHLLQKHPEGLVYDEIHGSVAQNLRSFGYGFDYAGLSEMILASLARYGTIVQRGRVPQEVWVLRRQQRPWY